MNTKMNLSSQKCESCAGLPPLTAGEVTELMKEHEHEVAGWVLSEVGGIKRINKTFKFEDMADWHTEWRKSAGFVRGLLDLMEEEDHHATYNFTFNVMTHVPAKRGGSINVVLVTHQVKGLSKNDFRMAAKLNKLYEAACA